MSKIVIDGVYEYFLEQSKRDKLFEFLDKHGRRIDKYWTGTISEPIKEVKKA